GLHTPGEVDVVLQRSGQPVAPMACSLDLEQRPRGSQLGVDAAEFGSEHFGISHRRAAGLHAASLHNLDELVYGTLGNADANGAERQKRDMYRDRIARPRQAWRT